MITEEGIGARKLVIAFVRVVAFSLILALLLGGSMVVLSTMSASNLGFAFRAQLVDLGPFRTVDATARVVLEEVEHGLDAHLGQRVGLRGADTAELGDRYVRELTERSCHLLDADQVRVEGLAAVVDLG